MYRTLILFKADAFGIMVDHNGVVDPSVTGIVAPQDYDRLADDFINSINMAADREKIKKTTAISAALKRRIFGKKPKKKPATTYYKLDLFEEAREIPPGDYELYATGGACGTSRSPDEPAIIKPGKLE